MKILERSYGGKLFIPRPILHEDSTRNLLLILTPWGNPQGSKKAMEKMVEFLETSTQDEDITSPFDRLESLSKTANNLRIATLIANDYLYKDFNKEEYLGGCEIACVQAKNSEVCVVTVGSVTPYILQNNSLPSPLMYQVSLAQDFEKNRNLPPLPSHMLGVNNNLNINIQSFRKQPQSELLLVNRVSIPVELYTQWPKPFELDEIALSLAKSNAEMPFWLGKVSLEE